MRAKYVATERNRDMMLETENIKDGMLKGFCKDERSTGNITENTTKSIIGTKLMWSTFKINYEFWLVCNYFATLLL